MLRGHNVEGTVLMLGCTGYECEKVEGVWHHFEGSQC